MQSSAPLNIPTLTVAGRTFTDLANLVILSWYCGSGVTNATLRRPFLSTGYSAGAIKAGGQRFRLLAYTIETTASGGFFFDIGYSDNDVGAGSATAFVNPKGMQGGNLNTGPYEIIYQGLFYKEVATDAYIPNGKYLSTYQSATGYVTGRAFGYEVA